MNYGNLSPQNRIYQSFCGDFFSIILMIFIKKETGEVFSDKFSIHFFELKKVGRKPNPVSSRELWLQFINADSEEALDMISQTNVPIMKKAVNVIYDMSEDTKIREIARLREKALHDEASALKNAKEEGRVEGEAKGLIKGRAEGRAEGKAEGAAKKQAELIANMKAFGMTDEQINSIILGGHKQ